MQELCTSNALVMALLLKYVCHQNIDTTPTEPKLSMYGKIWLCEWQVCTVMAL